MSEQRRSTQHRRILRTLHEAGGATRLDLAERTGLGSGTVFRLTKELLTAGWIAERGKAEAREGRPPERLVVNPSAGYVVGVAVDTVGQQAVVTDLGGTVVAHLAEPSSLQRDSDHVVEELDTLVDRVLESAGVRTESVLGIGLNVQALVDPFTGVVSHYELGSSAGPVAKWEPIPLGQLFAERRTGWCVAVEGTVRSLALAEAPLVRDSARDFAYVIVDQGVGTALVIDGRPYLGPTHVAGELAHLPVPGADRACPCGNRGCLSTFVSIPAIYRRIEERLTESPMITVLEPGPGLTVERVVSAAEDGDKLAYGVLTEAGDLLGGALAVLLNLLGFELVVIGSKLAASTPFLAATTRAIKLQALPSVAAQARIMPSGFGEHADVRSAANLVLHRIFIDGGPLPAEPPSAS